MAPPTSGGGQHVCGGVVLYEAGRALQYSLVWLLVLQFRLQHWCAGLPELDSAYSFAVVPLSFCMCGLYLLFQIIVCWCVVLQIWVWSYSHEMRLFLGWISRACCLEILGYFIQVIKRVKKGMCVYLNAVCNSWSQEVHRVSPCSKLLWKSTADLPGKEVNRKCRVWPKQC